MQAEKFSPVLHLVVLVHQCLHVLVISGPFLLVQLVAAGDLFSHEVAFLQILKDIWSIFVHYVTEFFNRVHPLRLPVTVVAIYVGEPDHFMPLLIQLGIF